MSCKNGLLGTNQLTDLLNYVLGLPTCNDKTIIHDRIQVLVVKTWSLKNERHHAERWCDCQLMQARILPRPHAGRWHPEVPKCLRAWVEFGSVSVGAAAKAKGAGR